MNKDCVSISVYSLLYHAGVCFLMICPEYEELLSVKPPYSTMHVYTLLFMDLITFVIFL